MAIAIRRTLVAGKILLNKESTKYLEIFISRRNIWSFLFSVLTDNQKSDPGSGISHNACWQNSLVPIMLKKEAQNGGLD
jgi:hypothetical protein